MLLAIALLIQNACIVYSVHIQLNLLQQQVENNSALISQAIPQPIPHDINLDKQSSLFLCIVVWI